jgi:hypothetical protein
MVAAEGGDLDLGVALPHQNHAEVRSDEQGAGEQLHHPLGTGFGRHIVILRLTAEQEIPDAAAHQVSRVTGRFEALCDRSCQSTRAFHLQQS